MQYDVIGYSPPKEAIGSDQHMPISRTLILQLRIPMY